MQDTPPHLQPKPAALDPHAPHITLFERARASRREIALALVLTACAVGFTIGAILSTHGP